MFWGGFNTVLEATNTEKFCTSCHEMQANVFEELKSTVHYTNRSGVRATCPDCHVPHQWTNKIARKMQASKEVWGHIFGSIDTREKFVELRRTLAEHEWARMKANDSLECRNCHSAAVDGYLEAESAGRRGARKTSLQRARRPASIATRGSRTNCPTCRACRGGSERITKRTRGTCPGPRTCRDQAI